VSGAGRSGKSGERVVLRYTAQHDCAAENLGGGLISSSPPEANLWL
jgi:hypothetical protein